MKKLLLLFISLCCVAMSYAAPARTTVRGSIIDKETKEPLIAANVCLVNVNSDKSYCVACDVNGVFELKSIPAAKYKIKVTYVGYKTSETTLDLTKDVKMPLSPISLKEDAVMLQSVSVTGRATRAEQKGDSLVYQADAFKVLEGSTAEELLAKMPGIVVEGGTVEAQGEEVKKVYVDGKEFFDGDVNLAIKNLPSDIIQSIEVFDKMSEQAEFTGFDDGESVKTINIVTRSGFTRGSFGKLYGGVGAEHADLENSDIRYNAGGNYNVFEGDRRLSILGFANNINNQNFSQDDISGVMSASSGGRGKRGGGGGSSASNFMVGSMDGVTVSEAIGFNYVDKWGEKVKITASYFFNHSDNNTLTDSQLDYFETSLLGQSYDEYTESQMDNYNHRINMKLDYDIDAKNKLQIIPSISYQNNQKVSYMEAENSTYDVADLSTITNTDVNTDAYNMGIEALYRHAFQRAGRSLSLSMKGTFTQNDGDTYYDYLTRTGALTTDVAAADSTVYQYKNTDTQKNSYTANIAYTDRLWDNIQLMTNYKLSYSEDSSDKYTYLQDPITDLYSMLDESLSNVFVSNYLTHSAGASLMYRTQKLRINGGVNLQYATLDNEREYPSVSNTNRDFISWLPSMMLNYSVDRFNSFRLQYRSSASAPSVSNLQDVVDNSNPLMMSTGNPDLDQQITHSSTLRYTRTLNSGHTFITMLGATIRQDYVADSTYIAKEDTEVADGIILAEGAQFTKPVNADGYYSLQGMFTYGFPLDLIRSNVNLSISANYANEPNIFEGVTNYVTETNIIPKVVIGSNISDKLDFTLSYSAGFNYATSTLEGSTTDEYTNHSAAAKLGWTIWQGITLASTLTYTGYTGLDENFDYYIWNASLGKKFLKNNAAEIKLEIYDILAENSAFKRTIGSNYYQYATSNVLEPYVMLSFVYTIRPNVKGANMRGGEGRGEGGEGRPDGPPPGGDFGGPPPGM